MNALPVRIALGAVGSLVGLYGAYLLLTRQEGEQLVSAALWLAGGVLVHDVLVSLAVLVLGGLGVRLLPALARGPAAAGLVVWGSLTVAAVPVLGRFGAKADNPTLLDRPYLAGWLVITALVAVVVVVAVVLRTRRAAEPTSGSSDTPA